MAHSRKRCSRASGGLERTDLQCLAQGPDGEKHLFAGGGMALAFGTPEVVASASDRIDVFAVAQDHALWRVSEITGAWSAPELLGGDILGSPSVCSWGPNRVDAFVVGFDQALYHKWWDGARWLPNDQPYEGLGGQVVGSPCAVSPNPGRVDVFVIGIDGGLYHKWTDGQRWYPDQMGYEPLGQGRFGEVPIAVCPELGQVHVLCVPAPQISGW